MAMKFYLAAIFAMTLMSSATANTLSGVSISELIKGKNVQLKTSFGTFPLRYNSDGTVLGDGTKTGLVRFFAPKETGKWWVTARQLCQRWPTWYDGKPFCFRISQTGPKTIRWIREDGYSGTASIRK